MNRACIIRGSRSTLLALSISLAAAALAGCSGNKHSAARAPAEQTYPLVFVQTSISEVNQTIPFGKSLGIDATHDTALELRNHNRGIRIATLGARPAPDAASDGWARLIRKEDIASLYSGAGKHASLTHVSSPAIMTNPGERGTVTIDETDKARNTVGLNLNITGEVRPASMLLSLSMQDDSGKDVLTLDRLEVPDGMAIAAMLPQRNGSPARLLVITPAAIRDRSDYPFQTATSLQ